MDVLLQDRILCILFFDVVKSTPAMIEAEEAGERATIARRMYRLLNRWKEACGERQLFFRTSGDGALATFDDPLHGLQAVVQAWQAIEADSLLHNIQMRVGLHVGPVSVAPDGDVQGAEANRAQRIMAVAHPGYPLVSGVFAEHGERYRTQGYTFPFVGELHLKGFPAPTRLHQICGPGLPTKVMPLATPGNLPILSGGFIGRKKELGALSRALTARKPSYRFITLVGMGGSGKTRLALELAHRANPEFLAGVYFVALEEAKDAEGVLSRIAAALSLPLSRNTDILAALEADLKLERKVGPENRLLLVLDNFEQALPAAEGVVERMKALPGLSILVTSRERLALEGERVFDLDPLGVPSPSADFAGMRTSESVRLFVERVKLMDRKFALTPENAPDVAALCRDLVGLPLALELVAAEMRHSPLTRLREIRAGLLDIKSGYRHVSDRQCSLRAAFDYSYANLTEADRVLFAQLGLFETAFSEQEAQAVCTGEAVVEGLRRLCEKSLVACDTSRADRPYSLLIPVRQYARLCLGEPEGAVRKRFIAAFTQRAQGWRQSYIHENAEPQALFGLQADLDNLQTAWRFACADDHPQSIADLGVAVTFFAPLLPRVANLEAWLDETEHALRRLEDTYRLGKLYNARARLANIQGRFVEAVSYQRKVLDYLSETGNLAEVADVHSTLAWLAFRAQDYVTAEHHARRGLELGQRSSELEAQAVALCVLANVLRAQDREQATRHAEQSLEIFRRLGERAGMAHASIALASLAEARDDLAAAEEYCRDALRLSAETRAEVYIVRCLEATAEFYARHGSQTFAEELFALTTEAQRRLGMPETSSGKPAKAEWSLGDETPTLAVVVERVLSTPRLFH